MKLRPAQFGTPVFELLRQTRRCELVHQFVVQPGAKRVPDPTV
jgi:hypothetical protein